MSAYLGNFPSLCYPTGLQNLAVAASAASNQIAITVQSSLLLVLLLRTTHNLKLNNGWKRDALCQSFIFFFRDGNAASAQGCQMAKLDPFLSLDCARVEGVGRGAIQGKEGIKFCSVA